MDLKPDMSVTDLAFTILKKHGKPMHFKELITAVMQVKAINQENPGRLIAQMHTEINLDSRFIHQGGGEWGLREWQPKTAKVVRIRPDGSPSHTSRTVLSDEDELDLVGEEEEEEELSEELEDEFSLDEEEDEELTDEDDDLDEDR